MKLPESMEDLIYWTSRNVDKGSIKAWVERGQCPECKEGVMGKPKGKDGKVKIRAKYYVCDKCGFEVEKKEYEETLTCNCIYTCPECGHKGEAEMPFKRKTYKGVPAVVFNCEGCNAKIAITKKMKALKKK